LSTCPAIHLADHNWSARRAAYKSRPSSKRPSDNSSTAELEAEAQALCAVSPAHPSRLARNSSIFCPIVPGPNPCIGCCLLGTRSIHTSSRQGICPCRRPCNWRQVYVLYILQLLFRELRLTFLERRTYEVSCMSDTFQRCFFGTGVAGNCINHQGFSASATAAPNCSHPWRILRNTKLSRRLSNTKIYPSTRFCRTNFGLNSQFLLNKFRFVTTSITAICVDKASFILITCFIYCKHTSQDDKPRCTHNMSATWREGQAHYTHESDFCSTELKI
jgi:hypothetical protein